MSENPYQYQAQGWPRMQGDGRDGGQAYNPGGLLPVQGPPQQNFNSMKDYKGEPLLPPPHVQ